MAGLLKQTRQMSYFAENSNQDTQEFTVSKSNGLVVVSTNGMYIEMQETFFDSFIGALKQFRKDCKRLEGS